jgi:cobalt/nickel transport system permease protein
VKKTFIERTLADLLTGSDRAANAEHFAAAGGALQRVDPRIKVAGILGLIVAVAASRQLRVIGIVFAVAILLALVSRLPLTRFAAWVWLPVLFFTGSVALPALFLIPGHSIFGWVTETGLRSAAFLISRAETAATLSALLIFTTPWPWVLKTLRTFRVPIVLVAILGMTYRYIFVMLRTAFEMFESRQSRTVGVLPPREARRIATSTVGVLLSKSIHLSADVHLAMQSRGFRGEVYLVNTFCTRTIDWFWLAGFFALCAAALWWGR